MAVAVPREWGEKLKVVARRRGFATRGRFLRRVIFEILKQEGLL